MTDKEITFSLSVVDGQSLAHIYTYLRGLGIATQFTSVDRRFDKTERGYI